MKSRIPQTKPSSSSSYARIKTGLKESALRPRPHSNAAATRSVGESPNELVADFPQVERAHSALIALGAPSVTLEEFMPLYCDVRIGDALVFVTKHVVGRDGLRKGRAEVAGFKADYHAKLQATSVPKLRHPSSRLGKGDLSGENGVEAVMRPLLVVDNATTLLARQERALDAARRGMDEVRGDLQLKESEISYLKTRLASQQQVQLLLEMLEKRETLRKRRIKEMGRLIGELTKAVKEAKGTLEVKLPGVQGQSFISVNANRYRIQHTQGTLTALYGYYARISRLSASKTRVSEPEEHQKARLIQRMQVAVDELSGGHKEETVEKLVTLARHRVRRKLGYRLSRQDEEEEPPKREELEAKQRENAAKEEKLQRIVDESAALLHLSGHYLHSLSVFCSKTADLLRASLEEEAPLTQGYIDVLRLGVVTSGSGSKSMEEQESKRTFAQEVAGVCGMEGRVAPQKLVDCVEGTIRRCHQQRIFLASSAVPTPMPLAGEAEIISSYRVGAEQADERVRKLLGRKVDKARLGLGIARDVEEVLRETRSIVG